MANTAASAKLIPRVISFLLILGLVLPHPALALRASGLEENVAKQEFLDQLSVSAGLEEGQSPEAALKQLEELLRDVKEEVEVQLVHFPKEFKVASGYRLVPEEDAGVIRGQAVDLKREVSLLLDLLPEGSKVEWEGSGNRLQLHLRFVPIVRQSQSMLTLGDLRSFLGWLSGKEGDIRAGSSVSDEVKEGLRLFNAEGETEQILALFGIQPNGTSSLSGRWLLSLSYRIVEAIRQVLIEKDRGKNALSEPAAFISENEVMSFIRSHEEFRRSLFSAYAPPLLDETIRGFIVRTLHWMELSNPDMVPTDRPDVYQRGKLLVNHTTGKTPHQIEAGPGSAFLVEVKKEEKPPLPELESDISSFFPQVVSRHYLLIISEGFDSVELSSASKTPVNGQYQIFFKGREEVEPDSSRSKGFFIPALGVRVSLNGNPPRWKGMLSLEWQDGKSSVKQVSLFEAIPVINEVTTGLEEALKLEAGTQGWTKGKVGTLSQWQSERRTLQVHLVNPRIVIGDLRIVGSSIDHTNPALSTVAVEGVRRWNQRYHLELQLQDIARIEARPVPGSKEETLQDKVQRLIEDAREILSAAQRPESDVIQRLFGLGEPAVPFLLEALRQRLSETDSDWRKNGLCAIIQTLGLLGPSAAEAVPILAEALSREKNEFIRIGIITALGNIGPAAIEAKPALVGVLSSDERSFVRMNVAQALANVDPEEAAQFILENWSFRTPLELQTVAEVLVRLPREKAIVAAPRLASLLRSTREIRDFGAHIKMLDALLAMGYPIPLEEIDFLTFRAEHPEYRPTSPGSRSLLDRIFSEVPIGYALSDGEPLYSWTAKKGRKRDAPIYSTQMRKGQIFLVIYSRRERKAGGSLHTTLIRLDEYRSNGTLRHLPVVSSRRRKGELPIYEPETLGPKWKEGSGPVRASFNNGIFSIEYSNAKELRTLTVYQVTPVPIPVASAPDRQGGLEEAALAAAFIREHRLVHVAAEASDAGVVRAYLEALWPRHETEIPLGLSVAAPYHAGPLWGAPEHRVWATYMKDELFPGLDKVLDAVAEQISVPVEKLAPDALKAFYQNLFDARGPDGYLVRGQFSEIVVYQLAYRPDILGPLLDAVADRAVPRKALRGALANPFRDTNDAGNDAMAQTIDGFLRTTRTTGSVFTDDPARLQQYPALLIPWIRLMLASNLADASRKEVWDEIRQAGNLSDYFLKNKKWLGTPFLKALRGDQDVRAFIEQVLKPNHTLLFFPDNNLELAACVKVAEVLLSANLTLRIVFVPKRDNGVMNDASVQDTERLLGPYGPAIYAHLRQYEKEKRFVVLPGPAVQGMPLHLMPADVVTAVNQADSILAIGEANTYTLNGLAHPHLYLGLRMKWWEVVGQRVFRVTDAELEEAQMTAAQRPPVFVRVDGSKGPYYQADLDGALLSTVRTAEGLEEELEIYEFYDFMEKNHGPDLAGAAMTFSGGAQLLGANGVLPPIRWVAPEKSPDELIIYVDPELYHTPALCEQVMALAKAWQHVTRIGDAPINIRIKPYPAGGHNSNGWAIGLRAAGSDPYPGIPTLTYRNLKDLEALRTAQIYSIARALSLAGRAIPVITVFEYEDSKGKYLAIFISA